MDVRRLKYSPHARKRLRKREITRDEVEAVVWCPTVRVAAGTSIEHYGYSDDGREMKVVTDLAETFVITITIEERRPRYRYSKTSPRRRHRR